MIPQEFIAAKRSFFKWAAKWNIEENMDEVSKNPTIVK